MVHIIGRITRSICDTGIATVFVESKYILPKKIPENSDFACLNSAVVTNGEEKAYTIILHLYKSNIKICQKEQLSLYYKVDTTILWFVNIVDYQ